VERFNPGIAAIRPHLKKPGFIECHRLSRFGPRGTDVDVVLDLMIHDLDMVLSFRPGTIEEVRASGVPVLTSTCDIANARIQFSSGCVANLTASRVSSAPMRRIRVFQRDAYLSMDYHTRQGMIYRRTMSGGGQPGLEIQQIAGGEAEPLKLELEAFLRSVASGTPVEVSGEDGTAALELAHRVLEAIEEFIRRHQEG
jgi:predicted dehydrogenase